MNRRRGRPRSALVGADPGTPELIHKRAHHATEEALDLCLARGVISREQHWCGIHLRWLYTLRYGAPEGVRAVDPLHMGGRDIKKDNPEWRIEREAEYRDAIEHLKMLGRLTAAMRVCVFNQKLSLNNPSEISQLLEGLDALIALWMNSRR